MWVCCAAAGAASSACGSPGLPAEAVATPWPPFTMTWRALLPTSTWPPTTSVRARPSLSSATTRKCVPRTLEMVLGVATVKRAALPLSGVTSLLRRPRLRRMRVSTMPVRP